MALAFSTIGALLVGQAELVAMRLGHQLVLNYNLGSMCLFSDAQAEVLKVSSPSMFANEDGVLVRDIKMLCARLNVSSYVLKL